jgi:hypothetical protein
MEKTISSLMISKEERYIILVEKKITNLEKAIEKAIINYDAEFKILINNQKLQMAAETLDIFKDLFGRIELTLSSHQVDFHHMIERFKAVGMEMTDLMLDLNTIVNEVNKNVKRTISHSEERLKNELKNNFIEMIDTIKNQSYNMNSELVKNNKTINRIPDPHITRVVKENCESITSNLIKMKEAINDIETKTDEIVNLEKNQLDIQKKSNLKIETL